MFPTLHHCILRYHTFNETIHACLQISATYPGSHHNKLVFTPCLRLMLKMEPYILYIVLEKTCSDYLLHWCDHDSQARRLKVPGAGLWEVEMSTPTQ